MSNYHLFFVQSPIFHLKSFVVPVYSIQIKIFGWEISCFLNFFLKLVLSLDLKIAQVLNVLQSIHYLLVLYLVLILSLRNIWVLASPWVIFANDPTLCFRVKISWGAPRISKVSSNAHIELLLAENWFVTSGILSCLAVSIGAHRWDQRGEELIFR